MLSSSTPSSDEPYKYDESFKELQKDDLVALPEENHEVLREEQKFDQVWIWVLMGVVTLGVFVSLLLAGEWGWITFVAGAILVASMTLMASFNLITMIDDEGVHYHANPFRMKYKTIRWEDMDQIFVRQYSPLMEYGGWGIRYGLSGWAYTVKGNQGIQIVLKNGRRILIGTQMGEEVKRILEKRSITV